MSDRLRKLLNMLGSSFEGERANAAGMIAKMAAAEQKTVADFVMSPQVVYRDRIVEKTVYRQTSEEESFAAGFKHAASFKPNFRSEAAKRRAREAQDEFMASVNRTANARRPAASSLLNALREARDEDFLTDWESEFIENVLAAYRSDDQLSFNQIKVAEKIKRKLDASRADPII